MLAMPHFSRSAPLVMLSALLIAGGPAVVAQDQSASIYKDAKVAQFVAAERMDGSHPAVTLSFWSGPHGKVIEFDRGHGSGPIRLRPVDRTPNGRELRIRAPDGEIWKVRPSKGVLLLNDGGDRPRVFVWRYQGPVDGRGTACNKCVPEEDALRFVSDEFMEVKQ